MKDIVVIFVEGGLVQHVDTDYASKKCDYLVIDWDVWQNEPVDVWNSWTAEIRRWFKKEFPDEYDTFKAEIGD